MATILSEHQFDNQNIALNIGVKQIQEAMKRKTS